MDNKYVIGLTGNIATGKSVVLRMLKELGAYTIDADKLVHVLMRRGHPLYDIVVTEFGRYILNDQQEIDRGKLGKIVFSDTDAMAHLEKITHPTVKEMVARLIAQTESRIVVVEAIKLIESGMAQDYDTLWVVTAPRAVQLARLIEKRQLTATDAEQRIDAQPPQEEKVAKADVVIDNGGNVSETWQAVQRAYTRIPTASQPEGSPAATDTGDTGIVVRRARREDLAKLADLLISDEQGIGEAQIADWFFSKGFFVAVSGDDLLAAASLTTENLVAVIDSFAIVDPKLWSNVGQTLLNSIDREMRQLSCEVAMLCPEVTADAAALAFFEKNGYERRRVEELTKIWREAVQDRLQDTETLLAKQLLDRQIVKPI
jgi:dephospho-CoA kinase